MPDWKMPELENAGPRTVRPRSFLFRVCATAVTGMKNGCRCPLCRTPTDIVLRVLNKLHCIVLYWNPLPVQVKSAPSLGIFTALHEMQTRYCDENSVRLSVRPSVCPSVRLSVRRVYCDKTVERSVQIYIPY